MANVNIPLNKDTMLDFVGAVAGGYVAYTLAGGEPLPVLATFVPWIAAGVVGLALWRHLRKS